MVPHLSTNPWNGMLMIQFSKERCEIERSVCGEWDCCIGYLQLQGSFNFKPLWVSRGPSPMTLPLCGHLTISKWVQHKWTIMITTQIAAFGLQWTLHLSGSLWKSYSFLATTYLEYSLFLATDNWFLQARSLGANASTELSFALSGAFTHSVWEDLL